MPARRQAERRFSIGDAVDTWAGPGKVGHYGPWDQDLGDYRVKVDLHDGRRLTFNEKGLTRSNHQAGHRMPVDEDAATELELYADNEFAIYKQYKAVGKNLMRFVKKGTFSMERAVDAFEYPIEAAAKMYAKEFASPGEWSSIFTPATRRLVARRWAENFAQKVKNGEIAEFE